MPQSHRQEAAKAGDSLRPGLRPDRAEMAANGHCRDLQAGRDLLCRQPVLEELEHVPFPRGQGDPPVADRRAAPPALELADDSVDAVVSSFTMCTIPDLTSALAEVRRVLRPGGALHFVEHGLAPDAPVQRWQHRLEPLQKRLFGGCHLTRPIVDLLRAAGFEIAEVDRYYETGSPKAMGAQSLGIARSP